MPDFSPIIHDAYEEILERRADPQGLANYNRLMNQGMSEADIGEGGKDSRSGADDHPQLALAEGAPEIELLPFGKLVVPDSDGHADSLSDMVYKVARERHLGNENDCLSIRRKREDGPGVDLRLSAPRHTVQQI